MAETILNGGNRTSQDAYTGPANEVTVDESNHNLRLHDGETPGGFEILSRNNADERYQLQSPELAGLIGLEPQEHGILVRLGPAEYVLREFTVNEDQFVIENADGYDGNPLLSLSPTINTEHTWTGEQTFEAPVTFSSGLAGDLEGDTTGTHNGNVLGNVTGNLTGDATGNHEGTFAGDVNVQGHELLLDADQIATDAIAGLEDYVKTYGFPSNAVVMWSGAVGDIPDGWFLCNGLNGTPDLRNRFIVGAGDEYDPDDSGGAADVTPTISVDAGGAHTHPVTGVAATASTDVSLDITVIRPEYEQNQVDVVGDVSLDDPGHDHSVSGTAESAGSHTHTAGSTEIDNRPPYYALCFIMKG